MENGQQALSVLIGESEASACFDEIERRIQPDDPANLKIDIQIVTIEKYINRAALTLPLICEKTEQCPEIFAPLDLSTRVDNLTEDIVRRLIIRITELSRRKDE